MKKLGEKLRTEREKKALSLHEIGMSLKINPKILQAIEAGEVEKLPAKTFLRGFVKSYAQYLKLNTDEIINLFNEEMGQPQSTAPAASASAPATHQDSPAASVVVKPLPQSTPAKPISPDPVEISQGKVLTIAGSILLIVIIAFVGKMVDKYQKERVKSEVSVESTLSANPDNTAPAGSEAPATVASDSATPTQEQAPTPPAQNPVATTTVLATPAAAPAAVTPVTPSPTKPQPTVATIAPQTTTPSQAQTASATSQTTTTPDPLAKPTEVIVEALNKVQIKYSLGSDKFDTLELSADQFHTFKSKTAIQLEISDGGSVNLIVNGRDKGVPGTIGKPIKLSYPK